MTRVPVVPTLLVALAVAAMVALGFWQLERLGQKEALLRQLAANPARPAIEFPASGVGDQLLFRRTRGVCREPSGWHEEAGRDAAGQIGWRQIVECRAGADGAALTVQLGVTREAGRHPAWRGGVVTGLISHAPSHRSLIAGLFDHAPQQLMIVADPPAPGLAGNVRPDISSVPNNHLTYAVQWFLFAGVAAVIYAIALRHRLRAQAAGSGSRA